MKRRSHARIEEPQPKKPAVSLPSDALQLKITTKLKSLFNGFVSEFKSISTERRPDVSDVFCTKHSVENTLLKCSKKSEDDTSSFVLENFINSAKSRISDLLSKKKLKTKISTVKNSRSVQSTLQPKKTSVIDPLQLQISLKLQSLLCKALDNKKSSGSKRKAQSARENLITENEWQDLSVLLRDFMSSAKRKISASLRTSLSKNTVNNSLKSPTQYPNVSKRTKKNCKSRNKKTVSSDSQYSQNEELLNHMQVSSSAMNSVKSGKSVKKQSVVTESVISNDVVVPESHDVNISLESDDCLILDEEPQRITDYLELEVDSDVDNPIIDTVDVESEEEVVVLGVKSRTVEEITIDEDEDEDISETKNSESKSSEDDGDIEELLFSCPQCDKRFRVESLLRFHIKMHGPDKSALTMSLVSPPVHIISQKNQSNKNSEGALYTSKRNYTRKETENKAKST